MRSHVRHARMVTISTSTFFGLEEAISATIMQWNRSASIRTVGLAALVLICFPPRVAAQLCWHRGNRKGSFGRQACQTSDFLSKPPTPARGLPGRRRRARRAIIRLNCFLPGCMWSRPRPPISLRPGRTAFSYRSTRFLRVDLHLTLAAVNANLRVEAVAPLIETESPRGGPGLSPGR